MSMNEIIKKWYEEHSGDTVELAKNFWSNPELPMEEYNACRVTAEYMKKQGFNVKAYHCKYPEREPNTVVATWGSGHPVIGIIGEYDALAALGQEAVSHRSEIPGPGHGCGHCLTTPACCTAAVAARDAMQAEGLTGTIKFMATPAEESGEGKVYMKMLGEFDDLDCCLSWHPMNRNLSITEGAMLAITSINVHFYGTAAHAAAQPEKGRSALDAAELTNIGVQFLREHVTDDVRMHYRYIDGGAAANVVPEHASLHYIIRARTLSSLRDVIDRFKKVARGAAMMTETEVKFDTINIASETYIVHSYNKFCYESLKKLPELTYTEEEIAFCKELYQNIFGKEAPDYVIPTKIEEPKGVTTFESASSDVGYLTHDVPMARLFGWGMLMGSPVHHWGVTALVGTDIGRKAAIHGGMAVAQCAYDILKNPEAVKEWKAELADLTSVDPDFTPIFPGEE